MHQGIQMQRLEGLKERLPGSILQDMSIAERSGSPEAFPVRARGSALDACKKVAAVLRIYDYLEPSLKVLICSGCCPGWIYCHMRVHYLNFPCTAAQSEGLLAPLLGTEMPLVPVLACMETLGVAFNPAVILKHKVPLLCIACLRLILMQQSTYHSIRRPH